MTHRIPEPEPLFRAATRAAYRDRPPDVLLDLVVRERNSDALQILVERYAGMVFRRARAVLRREDLAEEALQETFRALTQHGDRIRRAEAVGSWLDTTAYRVAVTIRRREARRMKREVAATADPSDTAADVPETAARKESVAAITAALAALPDRYRLPLELVYLDGRTHAETAIALGRPKGTVDSCVKRGLERLRSALGRAGLLSAAGAGVVEAVLANAAQAVTPNLVSRVMTAAMAAPVAPFALTNAWWPVWETRRWVYIGVLGAGLAAGGVGVAILRTPTPTSATPAPALAASVAETLQARNLRILEADVLPRVVEALQALVPGAKIELSGLRATDTRIFFDADLVFKDPPPGVGRPRFRFEYDTHARWSWLLFGDEANGSFRKIDPTKPIILLRVRELNYELVLKSEHLTQAIAALDGMPTDPRADDEATAYRNRLVAALQPYLGTWRRDGDPARWVRIEFGDYPGLSAKVLYYTPGEGVSGPYLHELTLLPGGRVLVPAPGDQFLRLSADGTRLELTPSGETWRRPP